MDASNKLISVNVLCSETQLRAASSLVTNLRYEEAVDEADEDGFSFPRATTTELQEALKILMRHENDQEEEGEVEGEEEVEEEEVYGWEELEEGAFD